MLYIQTIGLWE